jgi:mono/diheme cytochrome c family protein
MRSFPRALALSLSLGALGCGFNANDPLAGAPTVSLSDAPPPVSGGTLLITRNQERAVVSDPDRSALFVVALGSTPATETVRRVEAPARSEPSRAIEDSSGAVHVVLRAANALLTIDPVSATVLEQRSVCAEPRGLTFDDTADKLWVACARGELVELPRRGVEGVRRLKIAPDARDVVIGPEGHLWVSFFRSAAIQVIDRDGRAIAGRSITQTTLTDRNNNMREYRPTTLWRMRSTTHGVAVVNQYAFVGPEREEDSSGDSYSYSREQRGWRDPCDNSVAPSSVRLIASQGAVMAPAKMLVRGVLPVDVAVSRGGQVAVAFAGELSAFRSHGPQVALSSIASVSTGTGRCIAEDRARRFEGQVVAVDFVGEELVAQTREPARLFVGGRRIDLASESRRDTGHDYFHGDLGGGISCASCHAEGADDGHVWNFRATGPLRTPTLYGLRSNGPYHRRGDVPSLRALLDDTMSARMSGPVLDDRQVTAMRQWVTRIRVPSSIAGDLAVERGRAVFQRPDLDCAGCHSGETFTDGRTHTLTTSSATAAQRWMTPSLLGLSLRAPYRHDGSARSIEGVLSFVSSDREHRLESRVTAEESADLVAYLRSL